MFCLLEDIYCEEITNATADTDLFGICMTRVKDKEIEEASKKTWFSVVCLLAAFFFVFICKFQDFFSFFFFVTKFPFVLFFKSNV